MKRPKAYYQLLTKEDGREKLFDTLGMTEDRANELRNLCLNTFRSKKIKSTSGLLAYVVEQCEYLEEVVMVSFLIGTMMEMQNHAPSGIGIVKLPEGIFPQDIMRHIDSFIKKLMDDGEEPG